MVGGQKGLIKRYQPCSLVIIAIYVGDTGADKSGTGGDIGVLYKRLPLPGRAVGELETMGTSDGQTLNGCWVLEKVWRGSQERARGRMKKSG